jgi:hypothetical protein
VPPTACSPPSSAETPAKAARPIGARWAKPSLPRKGRARSSAPRCLVARARERDLAGEKPLGLGCASFTRRRALGRSRSTTALALARSAPRAPVAGRCRSLPGPAIGEAGTTGGPEAAPSDGGRRAEEGAPWGRALVLARRARASLGCDPRSRAPAWLAATGEEPAAVVRAAGGRAFGEPMATWASRVVSREPTAATSGSRRNGRRSPWSFGATLPGAVAGPIRVGPPGRIARASERGGRSRALRSPREAAVTVSRGGWASAHQAASAGDRGRATGS